MPGTDMVVVVAVRVGVLVVVAVGRGMGLGLGCMVTVVRVRMRVGVVSVVRLDFPVGKGDAEMLLQQVAEHGLRRKRRIALHVGVRVRMRMRMVVALCRCRIRQRREAVIPETREEIAARHLGLSELLLGWLLRHHLRHVHVHAERVERIAHDLRLLLRQCLRGRCRCRRGLRRRGRLRECAEMVARDVCEQGGHVVKLPVAVLPVAYRCRLRRRRCCTADGRRDILHLPV